MSAGADQRAFGLSVLAFIAKQYRLAISPCLRGLERPSTTIVFATGWREPAHLRVLGHRWTESCLGC